MTESYPDSNEEIAEYLRLLPSEQRTPLLRHVIERASGVDEVISQKILDDLASVGMSVVSTVEFSEVRRGAESFRHIAALSDKFPEE